MSSFRQPGSRPVFPAEGSALLNCPLEFLPLVGIFCACAQQKAEPPRSRAWLFVAWISCLLRSPFLASPAAAFQSLQKKKKKVIRFVLSRCVCSSSDLPKLVQARGSRDALRKALCKWGALTSSRLRFCTPLSSLQPLCPPTRVQPPP